MALGQFEPSHAILLRLEELLRDAHLHVRMDAVSATKRLSGNRALTLLRQALGEEADPRVRRKLQEAVRDLEQESTTNALQDRVTRLERQVDELHAQYGAAEALRKAGPAKAKLKR